MPNVLGRHLLVHYKAVFYAAEHTDAAKAGFDDSFIYKEIDKPAEERTIPFYQVTLTEHLSPFQAWRNFANKKEY